MIHQSRGAYIVHVQFSGIYGNVNNPLPWASYMYMQTQLVH